jgi:hypothetical protein
MVSPHFKASLRFILYDRPTKCKGGREKCRNSPFSLAKSARIYYNQAKLEDKL